MKNIICASRGDIPDWATLESADMPTVLLNRAAALPFPPELKIQWRGSPNRWIGRGGQKITGIVNHIMQSSMRSADSWFQNPDSEASAHFGVGLDGTIYQWVALENTAWTNGIVNQPDKNIGWLIEAIRRGINPNTLTIGIEHEGVSGQQTPEKQFQASLMLQKSLIQQYGIEPSSQYIIGHFQIDWINRRNCPGAGFPSGRLIDALRKDLVATPPPFNPNPLGLAVGPGMLAALTELGISATTNEQYYNPGPNQPGLLKRSFVWTSVPGLMLIAYEQSDGSWDVQAVKQL